MQSCGEKKDFGMRDVLEVDGEGFSISAIHKVKPPQLNNVFENLAQSEERINLSYSQGNKSIKEMTPQVIGTPKSMD